MNPQTPVPGHHQRRSQTAARLADRSLMPSSVRHIVAASPNSPGNNVRMAAAGRLRQPMSTIAAQDRLAEVPAGYGAGSLRWKDEAPANFLTAQPALSSALSAFFPKNSRETWPRTRRRS